MNCKTMEHHQDTLVDALDVGSRSAVSRGRDMNPVRQMEAIPAEKSTEWAR
jgi:hypothetical protein